MTSEEMTSVIATLQYSVRSSISRSSFSISEVTMPKAASTSAGYNCPRSISDPRTSVQSRPSCEIDGDLKSCLEDLFIRRNNARDTSDRVFRSKVAAQSVVDDPVTRWGLRFSKDVEVGIDQFGADKPHDPCLSKKIQDIPSLGKRKKERNVGSPPQAAERFSISDSPPINHLQRAVEDNHSTEIEIDKSCGYWDTDEKLWLPYRSYLWIISCFVGNSNSCLWVWYFVI